MQTAEIRSLAAKVYDQDGHTEADLAFLQAIEEANKARSEALLGANLQFGGGSVAWECVNRLSASQLEADYARALTAYQMDDEFEYAEAAE